MHVSWGPHHKLNFRETYRTDFFFSILITHNIFHTVLMDPLRAATLQPFTASTYIMFIKSKASTTLIGVDVVECWYFWSLLSTVDLCRVRSLVTSASTSLSWLFSSLLSCPLCCFTCLFGCLLCFLSLLFCLFLFALSSVLFFCSSLFFLFLISFLFSSFSSNRTKHSALVKTLAPDLFIVEGLDGVLSGRGPKIWTQYCHSS